MASRRSRRPRPVAASAAEDRPREIFSEERTTTMRRRAAAAAAGDSDTPSPWSSMHGDLVQHIAERIGDLLDYVRFRAACRHWRSSTADPRGRGIADARFHPRRWMMLPEGHGLHPGHRKLHGRTRFFNLDTGAFVSARIPELIRDDHCVLDSPEGLLLLQRDGDTAVRLLHPFTGDVVDLPPLRSLLPQLYRLTPKQPWLQGEENNLAYFRTVTAAVSVAAQEAASGSGTAVVVTVVLALGHLCRFAHASTSDRTWTLTSWSAEFAVDRALPFDGSLYMTAAGAYRDGNEEVSVMRLDVPRGLGDEPLQPPQTVAKFPGKLMILPRLVECDSEILVVGSTDLTCSRLVVVRLADLLVDVGVGVGRQPAAVPLMTSIGDHCLFFGKRSFAVSSKGLLPSITGNSIVLCCTTKSGPVQYDLSDGTLSPSPPCDGDILHSAPPSPHSIVHHLVTCCFRYFWNKGLMYSPATKPSWKTKRKLRFGV